MQTLEKSDQYPAPAGSAPTLAERIDAIEQFLQQLVLLLEVEPELNRESIAAWLDIVGRSERAHGLQSRRQKVAMDSLRAVVLSPAVDVLRPAT
ncbi:hypothetical protein [Variovorax sp. CY25R-8]|uniref:hypothetical protein n=1 Tax=Variovorax sp. CY25R-8 TaxID=2855501 RepID=UPI0021BA6EC0|nr:hypothetical protein [Variovorax sp. CY25R-8]MCT8174368.1 hypothetical protein [Variovorax sp. CY25R-8]